MQNQENLPIFHNENSDSGPSSPLGQSFHDPRHYLFKSPFTSGKKKKAFDEKINNENIDPKQFNPFSGPVFAPDSKVDKGKSSPLHSTPMKIKEEHLHTDFAGGFRDHNMGIKPYESPFSYFCKDFPISPGAGKLMSPNPLYSNLQYNFNYGNAQQNHYTYSPLNDHKESPAFRRNIKKIDFNPSNNIILKSHKEKVNIEADESDFLQLHNAHLYDDTVLQPTQLNFASNPSIYTTSMIPSRNMMNEIYQRRFPDISTEAYHNNMAGKFGEKNFPPRTPSPQSHHNNHVKLETINSFSAQRNKHENSHLKKEGDFNNNSIHASIIKGRFFQGEEEMNETLSSSKPKKKVCCNCKKSRCLKLYCDCFGRGQVCSKECNCVNCYNNDEHQKERQEAIESAREKNPSAFKPKIDRSDTPEKKIAEVDPGRVRHMKGCNCKKSGCLKRYCECYQAGVKCTELCKCENCKNMDSICRHKRAQNYGLQNFGTHDPMNLLVFPETTVMKRAHSHLGQEEDSYNNAQEMDSRWHTQLQNRSRDMHFIQDQSYYSELPLMKKRKNDTANYEFTPKRTLVFTKEEAQDGSEGKDEDEFFAQRKDTFTTPHAYFEKKRNVKLEEHEDYTPSPGKFNHSGKRSKRNVKLYSHFNPEEYELTK